MSLKSKKEQLKEKELRAAMACHLRNKKRDKNLASRRKNNSFQDYAKELLDKIKHPSSFSSSSINNNTIISSHDQNSDISNSSSSSVNTSTESSQSIIMSNDNDDYEAELLGLISDALEHEYLMNQSHALNEDVADYAYGIDGIDAAIEDNVYMDIGIDLNMGEGMNNFVFCPACQRFSMSFSPTCSPSSFTTSKGVVGCYTNGCALNSITIQLDHCQEIIGNNDELKFLFSSVFDRHSYTCSCSGSLTINPQFYQNIIFFMCSCNKCQFQENLFFPSHLRMI